MVIHKVASSVGEKGQVVIPKSFRDLFGISPRTEVFFSVQDDKLVLERKDSRALLDEFCNAVPGKVKFPKKVDWDKEYESQFKW